LYLCTQHFADAQDSEKCVAICNGGRKKGTVCGMNVKIAPFCGHHAKKAADAADEAVELKTRLVRLKPTQQQITILRQWFGVSRKYYNEAIKVMEDRRIGGLVTVRPIVMDTFKDVDYCNLTPEMVREGGVADAVKAISNARKKFKITRRFQRCSFRNRKQMSQSIYIPSTAVKISDGGVTLFARIKKPLGRVKVCEKVPATVTTCYRVVMKHNRFFYLASTIPLAKPTHPEADVLISDTVALDPGERTFQTFYSADMCGKLCDDPRSRFQELATELDRMKSKKDRLANQLKTLHGKLRHALKRKVSRLTKHIRGLYSKGTRLATEMHHKVALFLCRNFQTIMIPVFKTREMVQRLPSTVSRFMNTLAHFRFREFLQHKAREYGRRVIVVTEEYTTQTCSRCGNRYKIGNSETYRCSNCSAVYDRDLNAAKNILLKNFTELFSRP
jgi:putative transposase